ncbi:MAG: cysteine--tRNA ligase, partial [Pseudomonadota bacterium]
LILTARSTELLENVAAKCRENGSKVTRDGFAAAGVVVKDMTDGASWEVGPAFDPAKLEALR